MIAAVVVSLPDRIALLKEALDAVAAQTLPVADTVIGVDPYRLGEVGNQNRLIDATDCEWLAFLHDDDLWHPNHLEICSQYFDTADVVVSRYELIGRPWSTIEPWHDNFEDLRFTNWIGSPSMWVVRASVFNYWCEPYGPYRWVDWANLNRLLDKGARFADTRVKTVDYRFGPWSNGSWSGNG